MKKNKSLLLVVLGGALVATMSYFLYFRRKSLMISSASYTPSQDATARFESRNLSYYQTQKSLLPTYALTLEAGETFDAGYFPMTAQSDPQWTAVNRTMNQSKIFKLIQNFDTYVREASEVHQVPRLFIYGIMAVENLNGNRFAVSSASAVGVMQIKHTTATDSVKAAYNLKVLQPQQIEYLKKNKKFGYNSKGEISIAVKDLYDPEVNIHLSCIELSILIDKFGLDDPHKIMLCYNQGRNRLSNDKTTSLGVEEMIKFYATSKPEGADYIKRTLGKNGSFDILFNTLKVTD